VKTVFYLPWFRETRLIEFVHIWKDQRTDVGLAEVVAGGSRERVEGGQRLEESGGGGGNARGECGWVVLDSLGCEWLCGIGEDGCGTMLNEGLDAVCIVSIDNV
jgi:hypothetical protein